MNIPPGKCSGYGLVDLLKDKGQIVGVEIGCSQGDTTEHLLSSLPNLFLHMVDPYVDYVDWNTNNIHNNEETYQRFQKRIIEKYGDRVKMYKMTSDEAVQHFKDDSLDFIFIDGLHEYHQVKQDCISYYPKIRKWGLFSGHDYTVIPGVNKAVCEFSQMVNQKNIYTVDYDVWYWWKPT